MGCILGCSDYRTVTAAHAACMGTSHLHISSATCLLSIKISSAALTNTHSTPSCLQIMKSDEDVRMISAEAPVLFAKVWTAHYLVTLVMPVASLCIRLQDHAQSVP